MKLTKLISLCLYIVAFITNKISGDPNADVEGDETFSPEVEDLFGKVRIGLKDIYRRTSDVTQSLQENVVEVINDGREKLYILKEEIQGKIDENEIGIKCLTEIEPELNEFVSETKSSLRTCSEEVFQASEEYRRIVKDDIVEIESAFREFRKMIKNCFTTENFDSTNCYYDQVSEYNRLTDEIVSEFDEIFRNSRESAIEVLSNIMDCNKNVLKKAQIKQGELKANLLDCVQNNQK